MRLRITALVVSLTAAAFAAGLENPSFEAGSATAATGWATDVRRGVYEFAVAGAAHSGQRCLAITAKEAGWARWYTTDVFLLGGATYRLSCWVRTEGAAVGQVWLPDGRAQVEVRDASEWRQVQADVAGQETGRHGLYLQSMGSGTVFFDDIALDLVTPPPAGTATAGTAIPTDTEPLVAVVIPAEPSAAEGYLAVECQRVFEVMTGKRPPITAEPGVVPGTGRRLRIGRAATAEAYAADLATLGDEGIVLDVTPTGIACLGNTDRGTYYAVQELFHRLGCRWYMPGPVGECIPKVQRLDLPVAKLVHRPSFDLRGGKTIQVYHTPPDMAPRHVNTEQWVDWAARNRLNGLKASYPQSWEYGAIRGHEYAEWSGHTLYHVLPPATYFATHPEYYTLVKGQRTATHSSGRASEVCVANEAVSQHIAAFIIGYFDSHPAAQRFGVCAEDEPSYWCECPACRALDTAPDLDWSKNGEGTLDLTDRWLWFVNRIAEQVEVRHPNKWVHTFAYASTREVPRRIRPRRNVMIELTWWDRCFKHATEDPACETNAKGLQRLADWSRLAPVAIYGYLDYRYPEIPGAYHRSDADFYRAVHRRGVRHVSDEWDTTHTASPLLLNLRARLLWDIDTDVDAYIGEFCRRVYGPAAEPVREHLDDLERAVREAASPHVSFCDLDKFTPAVLARARAHLDRADGLAGDDPVLRGRLARLRVSVDFAEVCQLAARVTAEPALYPRLEGLKAGVDRLVRQFDIPILLGAYNYLDLKYKPPVAALSGTRLLELPEQWLFRPDREGVGEREAWFRGGDLQAWKPISTHAAWEGQGYPGLDGDAWYALEVPFPAVDAAHVYLLLEAVDETYKLWINGEFVGQSEGDPGVLWDKPQAAEITGRFRPGASNLLVVKVHDIGYAGGIWKPVWLTATPKGQAALGQE